MGQLQDFVPHFRLFGPDYYFLFHEDPSQRLAIVERGGVRLSVLDQQILQLEHCAVYIHGVC
jgi:hypothetical protein